MGDSFVFKVCLDEKRRRWGFQGEPASKDLFDGLFRRTAAQYDLTEPFHLQAWDFERNQAILLDQDLSRFQSSAIQSCLRSGPRDQKQRIFVPLKVITGAEPALPPSPGYSPVYIAPEQTEPPPVDLGKTRSPEHHNKQQQQQQPSEEHEQVSSKLDTILAELRDLKAARDQPRPSPGSPRTAVETLISRFSAALADNLGVDLTPPLGTPRAPAPAATALPVHSYKPRHAATCDVCQDGIRGVRYKCLSCPDWDACENCEPMLTSVHPEHAFVPIASPLPLKSIHQPVHTSVTCDSCQARVKGVRYKCVVCDDFDLCMHCEALPIPAHPRDHSMIKIRQPVQNHSQFAGVVDSVKAAFNAAPSNKPSTIDPLARLVDLNLQLPLDQPASITMVLDAQGNLVKHQVEARSSDYPPTSPAGQRNYEAELDLHTSRLPATVVVDVDSLGRVEGHRVTDVGGENQFARPIEEEAEDALDVPGHQVDAEDEMFSSQYQRAKPIEEEAEDASGIPEYQRGPAVVEDDVEDHMYSAEDQRARPIEEEAEDALTIPEYQRARPIEEEAQDALDIPVMQPSASSNASKVVTVDSEMKTPDIIALPCNVVIELDADGAVLDHAFLDLPDVKSTERRATKDLLPELSVDVNKSALPCAVVVHVNEQGQLCSQRLAPAGTLAKMHRAPAATAPEPLNAEFVSDVLIEDGCVMPPSALFTKIWNIRNTGSQAWPAGTKLVCVGGNLKDVRSVKDAPPAALSAEVGEAVDVSIECKAPQKQGQYMSFWRLATEAGETFGDRLWIEIDVQENADSSVQSLASSVVRMPDVSSATPVARSESRSGLSGASTDNGAHISSEDEEEDDDFVVLSDDPTTTVDGDTASSFSEQLEDNHRHASTDSWRRP